MSYQLGVDLGTTYTAAAVARDGRVETVSLGMADFAVPSVIWVRADGSALVGDVAEDKALSEPDGMVRHFKRRMGDPVPISVRDCSFLPQDLTATLLGWVVDRVTSEEGEAPAHTTLCHPANWGPYKRDLLARAAVDAGLGDVSLISEPAAAAIYYAVSEKLADGAVLAVYDLGGGTFDAAVLRKRGPGFDLLGEPCGIDQLGGVDFDELIWDFVVEHSTADLEAADLDDPLTVEALTSLRVRCERAKVVLSSDTDASITVWLPAAQAKVRLTRAEFESLIRPLLADTVFALRRALTSAEVAPEDVAKVLLVGGSSRIPLVGQVISEELGRPVAVDAHPKRAIALGTAQHAGMPDDESAVLHDASLSSPPPPVRSPAPGRSHDTDIVAPPQTPRPLTQRDDKPRGDEPRGDAQSTIRSEDIGLIRGRYCANGHFDDPRRRECSVCGAPMLGDEVLGARPPVADLVLVSTGARFPITRNCLIGRAAVSKGPDTDPAVLAGEVDVIIIDDSTRTIARRHAELHVSGWDVSIEHRAQTNGTFVASRSGDWVPVEPGVPKPLVTGTHLMLASVAFLLDAHRPTAN